MSEQVQSLSAERPTPPMVKLEFQLTPECNLGCVYCGNDPSRRARADEILSLRGIERCMDRLRPEVVSFTGGEVSLAWDRLEEGLAAARQRGIATVISSNLTRIGRPEIDRLVDDLGVSAFFSSFNDLDDAMSLRVRGATPDHRRLLIENLEYIGSVRRLPLTVETILLRETKDRLGEIHGLLASLGVSRHRLEFLVPAGHATWDMVLGPGETADALERAYAAKVPGCVMELTCCNITPCSPVAGRVFGHGDPEIVFHECTDGRNLAFVLSNGDMVPCYIFSSDPMPGNIYRDDPRGIWESSPVFRKVREESPDECGACGLKEAYPGVKCTNGCWSVVLMGTGELKTLTRDFFAGELRKRGSGASSEPRLPRRRVC